MAVHLQNSDQLSPPLLLQSQFFTDDNNSNIIKTMTKNYSSCFSTSSDFGSMFSSSVESEQGSTESESDQDDDYVAELTRKMAHYMLQDDENVNRREEEAWNTEWPKLGTKGNFDNLQKNEALSKEPTTPNLDFHSKKALIDEQIRNIRLHKLMQEQFLKQKQRSESNRQIYPKKGRVMKGFGNGQEAVQQQHRSGSEMTAVFLGESESKSGSRGTGVFLPGGITNLSSLRKKPGCSTVLIPARVVHALQLQYDRLGIEPRFYGATFHKQNDDGIDRQQQSEKKRQNQAVPAISNQETGLPNEWTY